MKFAMKSSFGAVAAATFASATFATDRLVPQQYPTIQAAVDASVNGDRVLISAGLYREAVRFLGKSVMLEGAPGVSAEDVVISSLGVSGPAVFIADSVAYTGTVGLRNLTITSEGVQEAGQDAGALISYLGPAATLVVEGCIFRDVRSGTGVGALYLGHTNCVVRNCIFKRNSSTVHGQAVYAWDNVQAVVENCFFQDHTFGTGTFYARINTNITVRNCVVKNSNVLNAHFQTGTVTFQSNTGCQIGALSNGGYVDGGNNNWNGPCPDCDANGVIDLEEILFGGADCNGNGTVDTCDIAANPLLDRTNDGVIDSCQCLGDISGNGSVDGVDLAAVLGAWGGSGGKAGADINGDGLVDGTDLAYVLGNWGPCPG